MTRAGAGAVIGYRAVMHLPPPSRPSPKDSVPLAGPLRDAPLPRFLLWMFLLVLSTAAAAAQQNKEAAISSGWVKLPAAGATQAEAYLIIDNPTAYDVFLQKASSSVAGAVEFRAAGKPEPVAFLTVTAYEGLAMDPEGSYLLLRDLNKPLTAGATVPISVMTDRGTPLTVQAVVK
jgi:periplasmic copper chaperone A